MKPKTLKQALATKLSASEADELVRSYDVLGSIAIIDVPEVLEKKEKMIAEALLETHKQVKTVLKKLEKHEGEFRTQKLLLVAGDDTRETLVRESGCSFLLDVEQVYFSGRLSTERLRLAELVQPGEQVLVMFSGAAPYVVVLAKHSLADRIVGVEKNPAGHRYGVENLRLNKVKHAELFNRDCSDLSFLNDRFDRIIMPAPFNAVDFLVQALSVAKDFCHVHCYCFAAEHELPLVIDTIEQRSSQAGFKAYGFNAVKAGQHAPYAYRWCIDFLVEKRAQQLHP